MSSAAILCCATERPVSVGGGGPVALVGTPVNSSTYDAAITAEPTGAADGHLAVWVVAWYGGATSTATPPAGWTSRGKVSDVTPSGQETYVEVFTRNRSGSLASSGTPLTATLAGGGAYMLQQLLCLSGANNASPVAASQSYTDTPSLTGVTVPAAGSFGVLANSAYYAAPTAVTSTGATWTRRAAASVELETFTAPLGAGATGTITGTGHDGSAPMAGLLLVIGP